MAAEMVIWDNLVRALQIPEEAELPPALKKELQNLLVIVGSTQGAVAALEGRDRLQDMMGRAQGDLVVLEGGDQILGSHETLDNQSGELSDNLRRSQLKSLSTLLYQADDLVDQILAIDQRARHHREHQRENWNSLVWQVVHAVARSTPEVSLFGSSVQLVSSKLMVGRVKKIIKDLKESVRQLSYQLDSTNQPEQRQFQHNASFKPIQHRLTGRKYDKKKIVNMLLQAPRDGKCNVAVICMSGLPGVGKSALAKDVYEDEKVKSHFDLRMWIPVMDITDETEIIRQIVESSTNKKSSYHNSLVHQNDEGSFRDFLGCRSSGVSTCTLNNSAHQSEIEIYERRLRNEIKRKHYLLILDDVCLQKWQSLRDLLAGGERGSKILMTTRNPELADLVRRETPEVQAYPLEGLKLKKSWKLFRTLALDQDERYDPEMKRIGFEIANICKHVPFIIKVAARFIHGKTRDECLSFIERLRLSKDIMENVLYLSYSDLPTRLRACFKYCSLFPDDFTFNKHDLISFWIAQGFVNPADGRSLEDAGEKYFMELSQRFLFEEVSTDDLGNILTCKMPHIIYSLASKSAAGFAKLKLTDSCMIYIPEPASKHVSVNCHGGSPMKFSSPLLNDSSLRTLVFLKQPDCDTKLDTSVCNQLISSYRRLRVLDLHDLGVKELPDSIGGQIHLKYLDLSKNDGLVTLPKSFTKLYNLQTLKLNSCPKLKHLDIDFGLLVNLTRFEVDGCESLTSMPVGLGKLTQLETLSRFVVGSSNQTASVALKALKELKMLRGRLAIEFTGDWMTGIPEAKQALITKEYLDELKISWAQTPSDIKVPLEKEILAHGEILENLKPHKDLKILHIEGYKGKDFPSWASKDMKHSLPNLVIISIEGCGKCRFLPPFGELAHLKKLTLRHMANVQFIEDVPSLEAAVEGSQEPAQKPLFFQSLRELTLHNFYDLEGWRQEVATIVQAKPRSFPCLFKLMIWNCPKLTSFPSFAEVSDLNLRNVNHLLLEECAKKAHRLKSKFETRSLQIKGCLYLESFRPVRKGLGGLPHLKHLVIESCDAIVSLASEIGKISSLESLEISSCKELDLSEDSRAPGRVGQVALTVSSMLPFPWKNWKSLHDLKLREIPKMKTLPDELKDVRTLKSLSVSACQSLELLPEWISSLTALQHLRIENCRALKTLPEGLKHIRSLVKVEITECPELMKRCREHTGEDWPKIGHARVLLHKSRRYGYV